MYIYTCKKYCNMLSSVRFVTYTLNVFIQCFVLTN